MERNAVILRAAATVSLAITLLVNALANALPINDLTTGEVADLYPSLFTPAGVTFSIWSIIYFLLIGFVIYAWVYRDYKPITTLLPWFILTCVLNASWVLLWHHLQAALSVVVMLGLLLVLTRLFLFIETDVPKKRCNVLLISLPFTIYFAWICVATIANVSALLVAIDWNALNISPQFWTVLMMGVATALGTWILAHYHTPAFVIVIVWSLVGIFLRWRHSEYQVVLIASAIFALGLSLFTIVTMNRHRRTN